jgi:hypothetical protein
MLSTIPFDDIERRARQARPGLALLTALTFIPFALGWIVRKAWMGLVWLWVASVAGWREAGGDRENDAAGGVAPGEKPEPYGRYPYGGA